MSCDAEPLMAERQARDAHSGRGGDGVADRGERRDRPDFADAARLTPAIDEMGFDDRRFPEVERIETVEIGLRDTTIDEFGLRPQGRESPDHAALDVASGDDFIKRLPDVNHRNHTTEAHP